MGCSSKFSYNLRHFRVGKWLEIMYLLLDSGSVLDQIDTEMNEETMKENYLLVPIQHPIPLQQQFSSSSVVMYLQIILYFQLIFIYINLSINTYTKNIKKVKSIKLLFYMYLL